MDNTSNRYGPKYKICTDASEKIYDKAYNIELTSEEIRRYIADELRRAYRLGYADGKQQSHIDESRVY
jgi:hypothetical protein